MKLHNLHHQAQHDERMAHLREQHAKIEADVEAQKPEPIEVRHHPLDKPPLTMKNGVVVMPGGYYSEKLGIAIAPDDPAWQEVK